MSGLQNHKIHTASLQVDFEGMEEGLGVQESLSLLFHEKIEPAMQQLFDAYSSEESIIKIEKMELDCGAVDNADWEKNLLNKIKEQVEEVLRSEKINGEKPISKSKTANEVFFYFLKKGYFPWNSPFLNTKDLEENLFLSDSFISEVEYMVSKSRDALKRISSSFSNKFFNKLIEGITKNSESWIKDLAGKFLKPNNLNLDLRIELLDILLPSRGVQKHSVSVDFWTKMIKSQHLIQNPKFIEELVSSIKMESKFQESLHTAIKSSLLGTQEKVKIKILLQEILISEPDFEHLHWYRDCVALVEKSDDFYNYRSSPKSDPIKSPFQTRTVDPDYKDIEQNETKSNKGKDLKDNIYIENTGMVLLHPFLPSLFENLNLVKDKAFISTNHRNQAIDILEFLVWGENKHSENFLPLNKILCGMKPEDVWINENEIPKVSQNECEELLKEVIRYWEVLKNTGIDGLRETFLQRPGKLTYNQNGWKLVVEQKSVDILIGSLPWGLGIIKLPWMAEMLFVEWN